jgi:hypothetical protein
MGRHVIGARIMSKPSEQIVSMINQAKHSFQVLKSSEFVKKLPDAEETLRVTNEALQATLKKMGLVSRADFEALEARVAKLEEAAAKKAARKSAEAPAPAAAEPTAQA